MKAKRTEGIEQIKGYQALKDIQLLRGLQSYLLLTDGTEIEAVTV